MDRVLNALRARGRRIRRHGGDRYLAQCPSHNDSRPSLSVCAAADGKALLRCFAGCNVRDIVRELGLTMSDLFTKQRT